MLIYNLPRKRSSSFCCARQNSGIQLPQMDFSKFIANKDRISEFDTDSDSSVLSEIKFGDILINRSDQEYFDELSEYVTKECNPKNKVENYCSCKLQNKEIIERECYEKLEKCEKCANGECGKFKIPPLNCQFINSRMFEMLKRKFGVDAYLYLTLSQLKIDFPSIDDTILRIEKTLKKIYNDEDFLFDSVVHRSESFYIESPGSEKNDSFASITVNDKKKCTIL
jgi:hypothetical protein